MLHGNTKYHKDIEDILIKNFETMNNTDLSKLLGISKLKIRYLMDKLNLKRSSKVAFIRKRNSVNIHDNNLSILLSDNLETFYWMGFIMADGWIRKTNSGNSYSFQLGIELSIKDYSHLSKLATYINTDIKVRIRNTNFKSNYKMCCLTISNYNTITKIMDKFQLFLNKTTNPPNFTKYTFTREQLLSMFIGFIDGDGTIIRRKKSKGFQSMIGIQTKIEWKEWLEFMLELVKNMFEPALRVKVRTNIRNHAYLCLTKQTVLENLRQFAINNQLPILDRKWDNIKPDECS